MTPGCMVDRIAQGRAGDCAVVHLVVDESNERQHRMPRGTYCCLFVRGQLVMSDAPFEVESNREVVERARGDVLIVGLGIGMILPPILEKPEVRSVLVVEREPDVVALVAPHVAHEKLTVVIGDAYSWRQADSRQALPAFKYDVIWLDIWPTIERGNLPAKAYLRGLYSRILRPGGWIGAWPEKELREGAVP